MADETVVAAAPAVVAAPVAVDPVAALNERFDRMEALLQAKLAPAPATAPADVVVQSKGPCAAARAAIATWEASKTAGRGVACAYRILDGLKTIIFFGVSGALALAQELQAIDLTPYVQAVLPAGAHVDASQVVVLLSVGGILLRTATKAPLFAKFFKSKVSAPAGASDSAVDEPADAAA